MELSNVADIGFSSDRHSEKMTELCVCMLKLYCIMSCLIKLIGQKVLAKAWPHFFVSRVINKVVKHICCRSKHDVPAVCSKILNYSKIQRRIPY